MPPAPITPWSDRDSTPTALQPIVDAPAPPMQALQPLIDGADMATSPTLGAFAAAMAAAQGDMVNPAKNQANPYFKSRYADLGAMMNAARPALSAHGLALVQLTFVDSSGEKPRATVASVVVHSSGEWIGCRAGVDLDRMIEHTKGEGRGQSPLQVLSSCNTYLRRIGAPGLVGLAPDDDDDGESNAGRGNGQRSVRARDTSAGRAIRKKADDAMGRLSPDQAAAVNAAIESASNISELRRVEKKLDATLAALDAPSPGAAEPSNDTTEDGWLEAVAQKIGEDADGNPRFGAMISGAAAAEVPVGTRLKVSMRNRSGKMRAVVTEIIEQMPLGVLVGTRKATDEEAKA